MSYEPLHHKYRPQTFAGLVGQEAIATTLSNAIASRKIAPAYMFTGPRGTGKTSSARILAKSLNCLNSDVPTATPCGHCEVCKSIARGSALDVIEIDAASNTGVDNIREIIERAQFAPVQCRYKVYAIDECLTGDSLILTDRGLMRLDDPNLKGKKALSYNEQSRKWEYQKILRWLNQGKKDTLKIKTQTREIRCTGNHLIRTDRGWIKANELEEGMKILSPASADADILSTNTVQTEEFDTLSEDINSKVINTAQNPTISKQFCNKQNYYDHSANVVVEKNSKFPITLKTREGELKVFNPTGKDIPMNWDTKQRLNLLPEVTLEKVTTTSELVPSQLVNGSKISDPMLSPQWHTNLEAIESISFVGKENVYDIEVENNHNFVANGLLVHNCHMLSTAAFNALLKTLEEPPARVVFVLATTDPQRVLTTIISRCQRFDFRRIPLGSMVKHLSAIADKESIEIADEAITLVAQIANGGLRDAESLLDQLSLLAGKVTVERVWDLVGAVPERNLLRLLQAIRADQAEAVIEECRHLMDRGREPLAVLQSLTGFYLNLSIAKNAPQRQDLVAVTETTWKALCEEAQHWQTAIILHSQQHLKESEPQLRHSTQPRLWLEVTLLGLLPSARRYRDTDAIAPSTPAQPAAQTTPQAPPQPATTVNHPTTPEPAQRPTSAPSQAAQTQPQSQSTASPQSRVQQTWQEVLKQLRPLPEAFVKQHCKLVNFDLDAEIAYISVRNTNLLPTAERFKPEIEKAFEQAWQETIRVQFQLENRSSQSFGSPQPSVQPTPQPSPASSEAVSTPNPSPSPLPRDRPDTPKGASNGTSNPIQNGYSLQTQVQEKPLVEPSPPPRDRPGTQNGYSPQTQVQEKPPIEPSPAPQSAIAEDNASTIATDIATAEQPIETPSGSNEEMDKAVQRVMQLFGGETIDW